MIACGLSDTLAIVRTNSSDALSGAYSLGNRELHHKIPFWIRPFAKILAKIIHFTLFLMTLTKLQNCPRILGDFT